MNVGFSFPYSSVGTSQIELYCGHALFYPDSGLVPFPPSALFCCFSALFLPRISWHGNDENMKMEVNEITSQGHNTTTTTIIIIIKSPSQFTDSREKGLGRRVRKADEAKVCL
ncbi:hypothetical protein MANES_15G020350v8 [Manihot esculenta]|uniref:BTB domain-containing protein n=1 Tax=Manihot esculenta TaxID=3983 RepID=A0A2C9UCF0_MANES|nr:hypothetical protein MANES_15G020350v8 [Manihot esculenta]